MDLKVLVVFPDKPALRKVAEQIASGCRVAGAHAEAMAVEKAHNADLAQYGLVFIGFRATRFSLSSATLRFLREKKQQLSGKPVAAFFTIGAFSGKKPVERALHALESAGTSVKNTLSLHLQGPLSLLGKGHVKSIDIIRAEAFGERTVNYFTGTRVTRRSEKQAIHGYNRQMQKHQQR
ncbi:MAG: hypothetical protein WC792_06000 [Candidatus Micrarchaeia archaeon]|jgi:flavodoxin